MTEDHWRAKPLASGTRRVTELLADSAFHPLDQWLRQREPKIPVDDLQAAVDQVLDQARQSAEE